VNKKLICNCSD